MADDQRGRIVADLMASREVLDRVLNDRPFLKAIERAAHMVTDAATAAVLEEALFGAERAAQ